MIRRAVSGDIDRMLEIYSPYVADTAISFEYEPPTREVFEARFNRVTARYPWIVWEEDGRVMGYAYADMAFERAAYRWDADMSVYLDMEARGRGVGAKLYDRLEALLGELGYINLYALVTADNLQSCRFHEKRGYELQGVLRRSGYKMGKWYDVNWYCLRLSEDVPAEGGPDPFGADAR